MRVADGRRQVRYVLGECYVTLENDSAEERLQKEIEVMGDKVRGGHCSHDSSSPLELVSRAPAPSRAFAGRLGDKMCKLRFFGGCQVATLKAEQSEILSQQDGLKKILYAKFGDNINLEEHDTL